MVGPVTRVYDFDVSRPIPRTILIVLQEITSSAKKLPDGELFAACETGLFFFLSLYLRHIRRARLATPRARPSLSLLARRVLTTITLIHGLCVSIDNGVIISPSRCARGRSHSVVGLAVGQNVTADSLEQMLVPASQTS